MNGCSDMMELAKDNDFDVVLIDTAGRMQDNEVSGTVSRVISCVNVIQSLSCVLLRR